MLVAAGGCAVPRGGLGAGVDGGTNCVPGGPDECNGRDDDCDGAVDEDEPTRPCGSAVGACVEGTQTCVEGAWGACEGALGPQDERCGSGVDEDCDGATDEGCACAPGATRPCGDTEVGRCTRGEQTCGDDGVWGSCLGAVLPDVEICNDEDDDCDGTTDEAVRQRSYRDEDGDGFGDRLRQTEACSVPSGYVSNALDCDDGKASVHPDAAETCNEKDEDCDGTIDEGVSTTYYRDSDGDGFGSPTDTLEACSPPAGYTADNHDCNDTCVLCHPGVPAEFCGDGADNDCDGAIESGSCPCTVFAADGRTYVACDGAYLSWSDARARCVALGGDLAFAETSAEHAVLVAALGALAASEYWLGGSDGDDEGTWQTVTGTEFTDCGFLGCDCVSVESCHWSNGEPNDWFGEDCLELWNGDEWNDADCSDTLAFVCELASST